METVNIHEAKTHLSRLLESVGKGESVIIAKAGKPVAKLVPLDPPETSTAKRFGFLKGQFKVPDDFDHMDQAEIERLFYGEP